MENTYKKSGLREQEKETYGKPENVIYSHADYDLVPPDGGWGWLVLAGSMLVNVLIPGTIKSFGVLFIEFLEAFKASSSAAAWIPALCYFLYSSLGPASSILSLKYSYRTVTLLGGASAAVGMIVSFWASSVSYLYLSYGILVGIGAGLSFPPTVYIVTSYFVKLRGLANGLCISGSALGSIILPPILRWLLDLYGYRGAILIMGGVTLNVFVAALFYEPVEQHLIRVPRCNNVSESTEEDIGIVLKFKNIYEPIAGNKTQEDVNNTANLSPILQYNMNEILSFDRSASATGIRSCSKNQDAYTKPRKNSSIVQIPPRNQTFSSGQIQSQISLYAVEEDTLSRLEHTYGQAHHSKSKIPRRTNSTSSFQYISTPYHGSTLSFQPKEFSSKFSFSKSTVEPPVGRGSEIREIRINETKKGNTYKQNRIHFFDFSLLKDPIYLVILISNSTNAIGYTNFIILLPAYGVNLGFDKSLAAYLISIVSATDLVGRIGGSALSDLEIIPKPWYFIGGLATSGISLILLPFASRYVIVAFWCAIFGLASGVYVGITAVIMADMLGTDRLTSSYGISLFVNGILQLVGPPICGIWFEAVQKYNPLFHTLGIILLLGSILWCLMPFIQNPEAHKPINDV